LRTTFFRWVESEYSLQLARQRAEVAGRFLESVELSQQLGDASDSDVLRAEYRKQNEEGRVLFQIQALERVRFQIFEQTGIRVTNLATLESMTERLLGLNFEEFEYRSNSIELIDEQGRILENSIEQAQQNYVIQQSLNKPKVNLLLSAFQDEINTRGEEEGITRNNYFIGLQVAWNIWDGGEGKARSRIALNRKSQLEKALELSQEQLNEEFSFLIERLEQMVDLLEARQTQIEAMDALFQQRKVEVEQGRAIADQLLDDQIDLDNAKLLYLRSVSDYFLTLAEIADLLSQPTIDTEDS
jgi:outer membrane protein TolC